MLQYPVAEMSAVFHALGDPTRFALYQRLSQGENTAGELAGPLNITLTATLQHLKVLEKAGLATSEKVGRERRCRLTPAPLEAIERWAEQTRRAWAFRLDALEAYLAEEDQ